MLQFIITGTGRCGTLSLSKMMTDLGIPCGHESVFDNSDQVIDRITDRKPPTISTCAMNFKHLPHNLVADASYMAVPYLMLPDLQEVSLIHVVRNPLSVISSFLDDLHYFHNHLNYTFNKEGGWEQWIFKNLPELNHWSNPIERACLYYLEWNTKIEEAAKNRKYLFHRIEDNLDDDFFKFIDKQGRNYTTPSLNSFRRRHNDLVFADIPWSRLKEKFMNMYTRYGYHSCKTMI